MKKIFPFLSAVAALSALLLTGCAGTMPQTADEFRQMVPEAMTGKMESFDVDRPFRDVARTFEKNGPRCLDVAVEITSTTYSKYGPMVSRYTVTYTPTVVVDRERAELHVQQHMDNTLKVYKEPEGGYFLLVADAYPVDGKRTRVDLYRPSIGNKLLVKAVRGWADGTRDGCPDLTKN